MALFQKSITNKYLKNLDTDKVNKAYNSFQKFYGDKERLQNIMQLKEENYQEGFLREIFVQTLGYTLNPDKNFNLTTEFKNLTDSRKADGAILKWKQWVATPCAVIELKSTKTKDLESIKEQAFGYKNNQPDCKYVITSNFQSIRFYIDNATEYEEFNLFEMGSTRDYNPLFQQFYLLLSSESILNHLPEKLKQETKFHDEQITQKLYKDYQAFKDRIFEFLCSGNPQYDKLTLFKKSQKLLDRFLFILFAEDSGLIPPNAISKIIEQWTQLKELEKSDSLYSRFQLFFTHLDKGHIYKQWGEIPAYNGGLFRYDEILDNPDLKLPDGLLQNHTSLLSAYDFDSEIDVNILANIFEHSLSEIEELTAELQKNKGLQPLAQSKLNKGLQPLAQSKRKKDGIFYTPKYITKYIVENTVGTLCNEKKTELQIKELLIDDTYFVQTHRGASLRKLNQKGKDLFETLQNYKNWLLTLKILDPACGSGAFLNATLEFLIVEHKEIDNIISELTDDKMRMFDTDKQILENNIYGVDINEESVEIAKLSLWLRTAQRGRALSNLSDNIKCGNSLIDDPEVAGEKAFNWEKEFPHIFNPAEKEKVYQKMPEPKPDYIKLIKEKSKEAQQKAEQAAKLSKEALEISKQVYQYADKIMSVNEHSVPYGIQKGGFDVVLGNPPYVRLQGLKANYEKESLFYEKNYQSAKSNYDIYVLFLEKSLKLIKQKGKVSFILPHKFLISEFGKGIRELFAEKQAVESLLHFGSEMVFADASTYTCILNLSFGNQQLKFKQIKPEQIALPFTFDEISYNKLSSDKWNLNEAGIADVLEKLNKQPLRVKDVFAKIFQGIATSGYDVYLIKGKQIGTLIEGYSKALDRNITIESAFVKPMLKGEDISKYKNLENQYFVIFPYSIIEGKAKPMNEGFIKANFPMGYEYLKENETFLRGRERGRFNNEKEWFLFGRSQGISGVEQPKIITPEISLGTNMTFDEGVFYHNTKCYSFILKNEIKVKYKFWLNILNSKLMWFFLKNTGYELRGGYFTFKTKYLEPFPLPKLKDISQQDIFIEKTNLMLSLNKALQTEKSNFTNSLKEDKGVEKITRAIESFNELEYDAFKKELLKQKVKISLGNENNEWREYFNTTKQKVNELQNQINQTDKEIDRMVYELYELTAEEIEIVENSVKE